MLLLILTYYIVHGYRDGVSVARLASDDASYLIDSRGHAIACFGPDE